MRVAFVVMGDFGLKAPAKPSGPFTATTKGLLFASLLLALACAEPGGETRDASSPCDDCNLLVVSIDTLRADHLSTYGYERDTSPNLTVLAEDGVLFERFVHAGGATLTSHMSMMTGLYPRTHGVRENKAQSFSPGRILLAEMLERAGFETAAFVDGGWMMGRFGFDRGFSIYDDEAGHLEAILPKARAWIEAHREERFFVFIHTYDVHSEWGELPYECPDETWRRYLGDLGDAYNGCDADGCASARLKNIDDGLRDDLYPLSERLSDGELEWMRALYDGCIHYTDERLGEFFGWLRERGLYDRTLIAVVSDHGEAFGEHGRILHGQMGYAETTNVPLILKLSDSAGAGRRIPHLASMVDLAPTLLELLGVPANEQIQGRSLVSPLSEEQPVRESAHVFGTLIRGDRKYREQSGELFDVVRDPGEQRDISREEPETVARLQGELTTRLREDEVARREFEARSNDAAVRIELSEDETDRLEALGYAVPEPSSQ